MRHYGCNLKWMLITKQASSLELCVRLVQLYQYLSIQQLKTPTMQVYLKKLTVFTFQLWNDTLTSNIFHNIPSYAYKWNLDIASPATLEMTGRAHHFKWSKYHKTP